MLLCYSDVEEHPETYSEGKNGTDRLHWEKLCRNLVIKEFIVYVKLNTPALVEYFPGVNIFW